MLSDEDALAVMNATFYQYGMARAGEFTPEARFAHYTSADTAMRILQGQPEDRCLWLRNATEMNDFSEVEFGQHCLMSALAEKELADRLREAALAIHPEAIGNAAQAMDAELRRIKATTFLLSLAVHSGIELERGKLSMWRAYGGDANVCILLNTAAFMTPQTAYDVLLAPVVYESEAGFRAELTRLAEALETNVELLRQVNPADFEFNLKRSLDYAVLSTKHPAFIEEAEVRVIYRELPLENPQALPSKVVNVGGIVQNVYQLPMKNVPDKGIENAELHEVLDSIIVGPTANPALVCDAFIRLLDRAGVPDPVSKVKFSGIPLRR